MPLAKKYWYSPFIAQERSRLDGSVTWGEVQLMTPLTHTPRGGLLVNVHRSKRLQLALPFPPIRHVLSITDLLCSLTFILWRKIDTIFPSHDFYEDLKRY